MLAVLLLLLLGDSDSPLDNSKGQWEESDVVKQVRESIKQQREKDAETWKADKECDALVCTL